MEKLVDIFTELFNSHFSLSFMLTVNVATYWIIKLIDELNGKKAINTWTKRLIFVITCIIIGLVSKFCDNMDTIIIINSSIIAPVSWSWIFKPILNKIGIDYRKTNK